MKILILASIIIVFLLLPNSSIHGKGIVYPGIQLDHVVITGTSNVADFKLIYVNQQQELKWQQANSAATSLIFNIPVDDITASNRFMVSDFKELVHARENPYIHIEVDQRQINPIFDGDVVSEINLKVTLAGISKWYTIPLFSGMVPGGNRYIMGRTIMNLSDFQLEPKSKIFGLIKIGNEVMINFRINLNSTVFTQIDRF